MQQVLGSVKEVLTGCAVPVTAFSEVSAINKRPVTGAVSVTFNGLCGDQQGDLRVHGGPEKAVHLYPFEHYAHWAEQLGAHPLLQQPGAFGENLSTLGLCEDAVCVGDKIRVGTTVFEVSQGRQPCWKLSLRFGVPDFALKVQQQLKTGWYFRVLTPGYLTAGDTLELIERPLPEWSIERVMELLYRPCLDASELRDALSLPLGDGWQRLLERRIATGDVENWLPRLEKS